MKNPYTKIATLCTALAIACSPIQNIVKNDTVGKEVIKQEQVVQQEVKKEKIKEKSIEEKLETISNFYEKVEINNSTSWDSERIYLVAREHLDDDNIKDYTLLIGLITTKDNPEKLRKNMESMGCPNFPNGPKTLYIEDRSKETGLGTVDVLRYYKEVDGIWEIVEASNKQFKKYFKEYKSLSKTDPDYQKKVWEIKSLALQNQQILREANKSYSNIISYFYEIISPLNKE
jgi:GTPase involved in cell partitioning and DNA repair